MSTRPVVVAKIGAPHGVKGDLKLHVLVENPQHVLDYKDWLIETKKAFEPSPEFKIHQKGGGFFIHFKDCNDRDIARRYVNKTLAVSREMLGDAGEGEVFWADLEGCEVINHDGVSFGVVSHLIETGANDVLVIKGDRERLVPYIQDVIEDVGLEAKQIIVRWDEDF